MKLITVLGAAMLSITALTMATPAQAAKADCPSMSMCIWDSNGWQGPRASRKDGLANVIPVPDRLEEKMDSWANNSQDHAACGYANRNGSGDTQEWGAGKDDNNVNPANSDEVCSWRTKNGC